MQIGILFLHKNPQNDLRIFGEFNCIYFILLLIYDYIDCIAQIRKDETRN